MTECTLSQRAFALELTDSVNVLLSWMVTGVWKATVPSHWLTQQHHHCCVSHLCFPSDTLCKYIIITHPI